MRDRMPGKHKQDKNKKGVTLIELIILILLLGIAASIAAAGFTALSNIGRQKEATREIHLAQQRLEMILAEKRHSGFPDSDSGCEGPDPCCANSLQAADFPGCSGDVNVSFTPFDQEGNEINGNCTSDSVEPFKYCIAEVVVNNGRPFVLKLYNHKNQ